MVLRDLLDEEQLRIRTMLVIMLAAFGLLLAALWRMQVAHGGNYQKDLLKQSVRRVRTPGLRGMIFDRNGLCVADNRPSYCINIYLEELRQPGKWTRTINKVDTLITHLAAVLDKPRQVSVEDIKNHIRKRLPLPLVAWKDIDEASLARLAEQVQPLPGVDVQVQSTRHYPQGSSACHVLGYVGRADPPENEEESYHYYLSEMAGKTGVEKAYDGMLRGEAGGRLLRVDVSGFWHGDLETREPKNGSDVLLTLDMKAQKLAEEALEDSNGACVIVDPSNGDIIAMASSPGYDPNQFIPSISHTQWKALSGDANKPLINRAMAGAYAPGSIFKPVVAAAALETGEATPNTSFSCSGHFSLGRARFGCWYNPGHGLLNMRQGIQHSCNVYFFNLGLKCGPEAIYQMASELGLGQQTGLGIDYESAGLVPNDAWKRKTYSDAWRDGDTCNYSIGQGYLLVTPLQMALMTAAIANSGKLYRPRLVMGLREPGQESFRPMPAQVVHEIGWSPQTIQTVRAGLRDVVMSERGTGKLAKVPGLEMAGKTGTAEIGRKGEGHKITWMIAFAPFDQPRYALVLMVEEGITGGTTAAPRVRRIMSGLFENPAAAGGGEG